MYDVNIPHIPTTGIVRSMMNIQHKLPVIVEAQVAGFAETLEPETQARVLRDIGRYAVGTEAADEHGAYVAYLRAARSTNDEALWNRADCAVAYEVYAADVRAQVLEPERPKGFLGSGTYSYAYQFVHDGEELVARVPFDRTPNRLETYVSGLVRGRGVPHLEQIVAYSYDDGVTVSHLARGFSMVHAGASRFESISYEHIAELLNTFQAMSERSLLSLVSLPNLHYDEGEGFTVLDYSYRPQRSPDELLWNMTKSLMRTTDILAIQLHYRLSHGDRVQPQDMARVKASHAMQQSVLWESRRFPQLRSLRYQLEELAQETTSRVSRLKDQVQPTVRRSHKPPGRFEPPRSGKKHSR